MIEKIIIDWINAQIPAYMEVPETFPATPFAVLEKTGGGLSNHIKSATIAVQSYGSTLLEAANVNEAVKARVLDAIVLDDIASVSLNSDYNYTDPTTKRYRYQAVFDIIHY